MATQSQNKFYQHSVNGQTYYEVLPDAGNTPYGYTPLTAQEFISGAQSQLADTVKFSGGHYVDSLNRGITLAQSGNPTDYGAGQSGYYLQNGVPLSYNPDTVTPEQKAYNEQLAKAMQTGTQPAQIAPGVTNTFVPQNTATQGTVTAQVGETVSNNKNTQSPIVTTVVPKTLSEYYTGKGQSLPSVSQRGTLYQQFGLGSSGTYAGTASQNAALLSALSGTSPVVIPATGGTMQNREGAYIPTDIQIELRNGATSYNPGTGGQAGIYTEAISGNQFTLDPNAPGGKKYIVKDGKTITGAAGDINDGLNKAFAQSDAQKTATAQKLIQDQKNAAIKQVALSLGMSEETVKSLLQSDANVNATYNATLKQIQAGVTQYTALITPPQITNGNNAYYKDNSGNVFRTSDNAAVTMGNSDPALDWNKLGLNVGHLNTKENALAGLLPAPIIPGSSGTGGTGGGTPDPGFDAPTALKSAIDSSGYTKTQADIKALSDDAAVASNDFLRQHDEITNNPEFPQWLKSRRNEFVSTNETRVMSLYNAKIKNLQDQATNQLSIATATYNADVKQYETAQTAKKDALAQANTLADNDRALLSDIMTTMADQGLNWSELTSVQQSTIISQFSDPKMANILGSFDFAKPYDAKQALDWAAENRLNVTATKKDTEGDAYGYKVKNGAIIGTSSSTVDERKQWAVDFIVSQGSNFSKNAINSAFSSIKDDIADAVNSSAGKDKTKTAADVQQAFDTWKRQKAQNMFSGGGSNVPDIQTEIFSNLSYLASQPGATRDSIIQSLTTSYPEYKTDIPDTVDSYIAQNKTGNNTTTTSDVYGTGSYAKIPLTQRLKELQDQNTRFGLDKNQGVRNTLYNSGYSITEIDKLLSPTSGIISTAVSWIDKLFGVK